MILETVFKKTKADIKSVCKLVFELVPLIWGIGRGFKKK